MELTIDLKKLKETIMFVEDFFVLALINAGENPLDYLISDGCVRNLELEMWIKSTDEGYELRGKARELFESKQSLINFDEFWDVFPSTTPSGRPLRANTKEWGGKPTRDYTICKKKYLSKVKTPESHNQIVKIVKARIDAKDYEFINNMETYINQEKWQQDVKYLTNKPLVGRIGEMS